MIREQKPALTILIAMSLAIVSAVAAVTTGIFHLRWLGIALLFSVVAVACAGGVVFFRLRPNRGAVVFDERDRQIQKNASLAAYGIGYFILMLGSFAPFFLFGENASIPVTWLPLIFVGAGVCHAYAFFVSLLVQYGRGGHDHE